MLLSWRPSFSPWAVRVGFIVDKVALVHDFTPVFLFSLVIILPVLIIHIHLRFCVLSSRSKSCSWCEKQVVWCLGAFAELRRATFSFVMSVRPPARLSLWNKLDSHWTSFHVILYDFFFNLLRKWKFNESLARITGTLHDVCTFMTISGQILRRVRNSTHKSYIENQNKHFIFNNFGLAYMCAWHLLSNTTILLAIYEAYNNYMFRPCPWAIIRLYQRSLRLS